MNVLIELGYWIAKYECIDTWRVDLEEIAENKWSLRWAGPGGGDEETSEGTAEELIEIMKKAIVESSEPRSIRFEGA